jgi:hypothetical protein
MEAATTPPRRSATRQVSTRVSAPIRMGSQRSAMTLTPPIDKNGVASSTLSAPI